MKQYTVTIRVSSSASSCEDIDINASNLCDLDAKLHNYAHENDIKFDIVSIHVFQNKRYDYNPLPF